MCNHALMEEAVNMAQGAGINNVGRFGHKNAACSHQELPGGHDESC